VTKSENWIKVKIPDKFYGSKIDDFIEIMKRLDGGRFYVDRYSSSLSIWFDREEDATLFLMRWQ
jgi:hypothetical protein